MRRQHHLQSGVLMLDKMKQLMEMQRKMQELKRELENTVFEVESGDRSVKIVMSGSQEVKEVLINADLSKADRPGLERASKDAFSRALKRAQEIAAAKMKEISGLNIPGLT